MPPLHSDKAATFWDLTAGLHADVSPVLIPDNACQSCNNVVGYEGKLRPRAGFTEVLATLGAGLEAFHLTRHQSLAGVATKAALSRNTATNAVLFWEWNGAAWVNRTGAAVLSGTSGFHPMSCSFKGALYFVDGNDDMYTWAAPGGNIATVPGAGATTPFQVPKHLLAWDGRLWHGNVIDTGNRVAYRVAWSDFNLADVWRGGVTGGSSGYQDLIDSTEDDVAPLTAMIDTVDMMVAFKADSIYEGAFVDYPKYYEFRKLSRGIGCVSQGSLRRYLEDLVWLGDDNVYTMVGRQVKPVGDSIVPRIRNVVNTNELSRAVGIVDPIRKLYWLFVPPTGTTTNTKLFILSFRDGGTWWEGEIANANIKALCGLSDRQNPWNRVLTMGSTDGRFYKIDPSAKTDATTAFSPTWRSKRWDALQVSKGEVETIHIVRLAVHAGSGKITAEIASGPNLDQISTDKAVGEIVLNGRSDRYNAMRQGDRFAEIELTWDMTGDVAEVEGLSMSILPRGQVR